MRTLKELQAYFKEHKMVNARRYENYKFVIGGVKKGGGGYSWVGPYWEGGTWIGCAISQASHCCGVMEMGCFSGGNEDVDHWKALIEYVLIKEKLTYLRAETITDKDPHINLEKAMIELGFRLVTTIPSKHGKREHKKYDIHVWEWLKPQAEKKAA